MTKTAGTIRRFLCWCAAVDLEIIADPQLRRIARIKYSILGALIVVMATVAGLGWFHLAISVLPWWIGLGLGVAMSTVAFCTERALIVSIPPKLSTIGKIAAFSWRCLIACVTAAVVSLPLSLGYFNNQIVGRLDDERLVLMSQKREEIGKIFGLSRMSADVQATDEALVSNERAREHLPAGVQAHARQSSVCNVDYDRLRSSTEPKIARALKEKESLERQSQELPWDTWRLQPRMVELTRLVAAWKGALRTKSQVCAELARKFNSEKQSYLAALARQHEALYTTKSDQENALSAAKRDASRVRRRSDEVIELRTSQDVGDRVRVLASLAHEDFVITLALFMIFAYFFMIDTLPVITKLANPAAYERSVAAQEHKLRTELDADAVVAEVTAEIKAETAKARLAALLRFYVEDRGQALRGVAQAHARVETAKADVLTPFVLIEAFTGAYRKAQRDLSEIEESPSSGKDAAEEVARIRAFLSSLIRQATEKMKSPNSSPASGADSAADLAFRKTAGTA